MTTRVIYKATWEGNMFDGEHDIEHTKELRAEDMVYFIREIKKLRGFDMVEITDLFRMIPNNLVS